MWVEIFFIMSWGFISPSNGFFFIKVNLPMSASPTVLLPASEDDPPAQVTLVIVNCTNILDKDLHASSSFRR